MEKAEVTRLINSFNAIKGYFDTTKKYMPQIAKLVFFIEEVIPLFDAIHKNLHQSSELLPSASLKLDKVTSATEMATTEVMDIVDNVIARLNTIGERLTEMDQKLGKEMAYEAAKAKLRKIHEEVDGTQDDLFSIMNALQFQDITTQQINSVASDFDKIQTKIAELLTGFDEDGFKFIRAHEGTFDSNAEFDFKRSAQSQEFIDEILKVKKEGKDNGDGAKDHDLVIGEDGQPDISAIINQLNGNKD